MSKINELRTQRAKAWEKAQAFLTANRDERGILSDENVKIYEGLEQDIVNLGKEIDRQERLDAMEREMAAPVSTPITEKPENTKKPDTKVGRASDAYTKAFWTQVRAKDGVPYEVRNALSEGVDSEGGYLVPDEFENTLVSGMEEEGSIRSLAHVFTTSNGVHKIPVVRTKGTANWIDEGGSYGDSDDVFGQEQIKRTETYTENKAACYRLPNTTTMENLSMQVSAGEGAVLKMGDKVLVTDIAWKGFIAGVYEFIETPEETGFGYIECRLNLIAMSAELFEDGGHAKDMSPPTKELMKLVLEEKIAHGGHPVLRWMMDNIFIRTDPAGNIKPDKEKSTEKIDGAVATIMALDRAIRCGNDTGASVYDDRGILFI